MNKHSIADAYHALHILALIVVSPATLFHRLYGLSWYQATLQSWVDSMAITNKAISLEVGCASGQLAEYISRPGVSALGVDISIRMIKKAKARQVPGATFSVASVMELPFENNRFDYILAASLINVVSEPGRALSEMVRICKPGGQVSILVPQTGMRDEAVAKLSDDLNLSGFSRAALLSWHRRARKLEPEKVLEYFRIAGLHNVVSQTYLDGMVLTITGTCNAHA